MLLKDKFYKVLNEEHTSATSAAYRLAIIPECAVYKGHFPGNPVCPGVCNIETIKECAMALLKRNLRISHIKQCRLTAIASPAVCPEVTVNVNATDKGQGAWLIMASIADATKSYMEFKGTLTEN